MRKSAAKYLETTMTRSPYQSTVSDNVPAAKTKKQRPEAHIPVPGMAAKAGGGKTSDGEGNGTWIALQGNEGGWHALQQVSFPNGLRVH